MQTKQDTQLSLIIANAVLNNKDELVLLLRSNSVPVPDFVSDEKLVDITVNALSDSTKIQQAFLDWIGYKIGDNQYRNIVGSIGMPTNTTVPTTTTTSGSFWSNNASSIFGLVSSGLGLFGGIQNSKDQANAIKAQANANIAAAQSNVQVAQIQQQTALAQLAALQGGTGKTGNNTIIYVGIGIVSLIAVGAIIYAVKK